MANGFVPVARPIIPAMSPVPPDIGPGTVKATGSTTARTAADRAADVVNVKDYGAKGDGVTDDTAAVQAAAATGQSLYFPAGVYGITAPVGFRDRTSWSAAPGASLKALAGFTGAAMVYDYAAATNVVLRDLEINGNSVAAVGLKTTLSNTSTLVFERLYIHGATSHGMYLVKAIGANLIGVKSDHNGGDGFRLEDSNLATLTNCRAVSNAGNGLLVQKGVNAFSSGVRVFSGDYEANGDNGVVVVNASSVTVLEGAWIEANTNDGVKVGSAAAFVPVFMHGCNVMILANGGATNWAVRLDAGVRGRISGNNLFNSGGSRNYIYDGSDGAVDTAGNYNGNAGETRPTMFPTGSAVVLASTDYAYEAVKWWQGPGDAVTWTPILTAKLRSSIEVEIAGADDSSATAGTFLVKTWTTANNATRVSQGEIGGTLAKTSGTYYFPVGTNAEAPNVRWNGDNLEIKQGSGGSDKMTIHVRAKLFGTAYRPTWLVN